MAIVKTKEEIQEAIETLKQNREKCAPFNFFGESNVANINVMIDVIEHKRSEDWIYENYPSEDEFGEEDTASHSKWQNAINALEFLRGECPLEDLLYPERK